jgi:5-methylcytosine-specific restriction protein A
MAKLRTLGHKLRPSSTAKVNLPEKQADSFYTSPAWRRLMDEIIRERGRRCEDPEHDPRRPRSGFRIFGDHIRERRDAPHLELVKANVLLRCGSCHTRKTAAERAKRFHCQGEGGQNL